MRKGQRKQFCLSGHDTFICGRTQKRCNDCDRDRRQRIKNGLHIVNHIKQFCPRGHDTFVCGRRNKGNCISCIEEDKINPRKIGIQFCPKGHNTFATGRYKHGECVICRKERKKSLNGRKEQLKYRLTHKDKIKIRDKNYRENNKEEIKIKQKEHYIENREKLLVKQKEYYETHKEEMAAYQKEYNEKNSEKVKARRRAYRESHKEELNKKATERKAIDLNFKLACNLRSRLNQAIKTNAKVGSAIRDLGCSIPFFREYIASKFLPGMTWDNWGKGKDKWHLDHVIPLVAFDLTDREQFLQAVHYLNYQPLWEPDNLKKNKKIL